MRWLLGRLVGVVRSWGLSLCFTLFRYDGVVRLQREGSAGLSRKMYLCGVVYMAGDR